MKIIQMSRADILAAVELWNDCVKEESVHYTAMDEAQFSQNFFDTPFFDARFLLVAKENEQMIGYAIANYKKEYLRGETFENTPLYLTMLMVRPENRRKGVAAALLQTLQTQAKAIGKTAIAITYRNPTTLSWTVPHTQGHTHNNAPGVDKTSAAYCFFAKQKFLEKQTELGMYLPLANFTLPQKYGDKVSALHAQQIEIVLFDAQKHSGFEELFTALHGEVWRQTMHDNALLAQPLPVLVAVHQGKIVGFAGPIDQEASGRGWFNGIATHPDYERRGIAMVLFCRLMLAFQEIGARFSTLFTDAGNPAAGLYQSVGFTVVKEWAVMGKEL